MNHQGGIIFEDLKVLKLLKNKSALKLDCVYQWARKEKYCSLTPEGFQELSWQYEACKTYFCTKLNKKLQLPGWKWY